MCLCIPESQRSKPVPGRWINESGRVAHPNSPAGLGGPGAFRLAGLVGTSACDDLLPSADAPAAKGLDPTLIALAEDEEEKKAVRQPPPKVTANAKAEVVQKVMTLKLNADGSNAAGVKGALTNFKQVASGSIFKNADTNHVVTSFNNGIVWVITIQTRYGSGKPDGDAAYGRGTTRDDIKEGNVTLGFHEHCHRQLLLRYFRDVTFPAFDGAVGDTVADFEAKVATYDAATQAYFDEAEKRNIKEVDETGDPTLSVYRETHPE